MVIRQPVNFSVLENLPMARQPSTKSKEINRRNDDRRKQELPVALERRKVQRRRQIDPTTCEREYNQDEVEFMQALDQYKRDNGRMFPTCSEILEVIRKIGYVKLASEANVCHATANVPSEQTGSKI
jgi:hypothetical protein